MFNSASVSPVPQLKFVDHYGDCLRLFHKGIKHYQELDICFFTYKENYDSRYFFKNVYNGVSAIFASYTKIYKLGGFYDVKNFERFFKSVFKNGTILKFEKVGTSIIGKDEIRIILLI